MVDQNTGAEGATDVGATGATEPKPERGDSGESLNSRAKELPWVQDLMRASAELKRIKEEQEKAAAEAERKRAESQGEYEKALALEQEEKAKIKAQYEIEVKNLKLRAAFAQAGIVDPRAVTIFADGYDPETDIDEYVVAVKADAKNAVFFDTKRTALKAPRSTGTTPPDEFDPERDLQSWLKSRDPKKRARAIQHNREKYERQFRNE